jgi:hypothetical protein
LNGLYSTGGGGGASDIRLSAQDLTTRLVVAAGKIISLFWFNRTYLNFNELSRMICLHMQVVVDKLFGVVQEMEVFPKEVMSVVILIPSASPQAVTKSEGAYLVNGLVWVYRYQARMVHLALEVMVSFL